MPKPSKPQVDVKSKNVVCLVGQDHAETFTINLKNKRPIVARLEPNVPTEVPDEIVQLIKEKCPLQPQTRHVLDAEANERDPHVWGGQGITRAEPKISRGPIIVGSCLEDFE